jgi:hypothetical protein
MKGIQIIYSPSWNRWNINSEVCRLEYIKCEDTGEIAKRSVLERIFAYLKDQFPEKEFVQVSPDEWREKTAPRHYGDLSTGRGEDRVAESELRVRGYDRDDEDG